MAVNRRRAMLQRTRIASQPKKSIHPKKEPNTAAIRVPPPIIENRRDIGRSTVSAAAGGELSEIVALSDITTAHLYNVGGGPRAL
jgi:hypothetical protein